MAAASSSGLGKSALIVVDFQEDFCPPNGALAIMGGRDIAKTINRLLKLPFKVRVATLDWHPTDHISFASNHDGAKPGTTVIVPNPSNASEEETIMLWPIHCVQGSKGAELVPELDVERIDHFVKKGQDRRVEMFSAFRDSYKAPTVSKSDLLEVLQSSGVEEVYVVGLAADCCVKHTAFHAAEEGFKTFVLSDATKAVDHSAGAMDRLRSELKGKGADILSSAEAGLIT